MPELPEVETVRRRLVEHLVRRTLVEVEILDYRLTDPEPPHAVAARLTGARIEALGRRGKYLLIELSDGAALVVHLRMTGNLLWLPQRQGIRRIGLLDFQGAALGHPAYDLASLLEDERRDIPTEHAEHAIAYYLAARPELDPTAFRAAYAACAAQRHLRIAGQWVRLERRDGRPGYLIHGPRTWRLLQRSLCEPVAAPLAAALDRWIPPDRSRNPPVLAT